MRRQTLLDILGVLLASLFFLLIAGQFADLRRLHVGAWNDQAGYVSVARNLIEKGELKSSIVYTSTLKQKATRNYLYMPGHYVALALSFVVAGTGPVQAVLPSLVCYCIATVSVFLTSRRLYGRKAAFIAAAIFALFPAILPFAFTAMAELTLLAAVSVTFCAFVHLPPVFRPYAGTLLLAVPFVFRETAALLVIPMTGLVLGGIPLLQRIEPGRWRAACIFFLLSVGFCAYLFKSPLADGRPSLLKVNVFDTGERGIYLDATAEERLPNTARAWAGAIGSNAIKNVRRLTDTQYSEPRGHEPLCLGVLFCAVVLSLALGWHRRDGMALGCGILGLALLGFLFGLYHVCNYRGVRTLLFAWPLFAAVIGAWAASLTSWPRLARLRPWHWTATACAFVGAGLALACQATGYIASYDKSDDEMVALVESTGHDPRQMLASPYWLGLPYAAAHHPAEWAFLPYNAQTLSLLIRKHDVGTLIVPPGSTSLTAAYLKKVGFVRDRHVTWGRQKLAVYKRTAGSPQARSSP